MNLTKKLLGACFVSLSVMLASCSMTKQDMASRNVQNELGYAQQLKKQDNKTMEMVSAENTAENAVQSPALVKQIEGLQKNNAQSFEKAEKAVASSSHKKANLFTTLKTVKQLSKELKKAEQNKKPDTLTAIKHSMGGGKSQLVALLLAILVGGLGIHRFYLGYIGIGIIQLITLGGCGIWALIDLIRIATGDLQPKDGSYDKTL